jgi:hypothetical protein
MDREPIDRRLEEMLMCLAPDPTQERMVLRFAVVLSAFDAVLPGFCAADDALPLAGGIP